MTDDSENARAPEGNGAGAGDGGAGGGLDFTRPVGSGPATLGVTAPDQEAAEVLDFWYGELTPADWFRRDEALDRAVSERFGLLVGKVGTGLMPHWADSAGGVLAGVIALDQFPRNIYRGDPRAHATDDHALGLAEQALDKGLDRGMGVFARQFLYMPFMHSEELADQERALALFETLDLPEAMEACRQHHRIVARFGRFPHRNAVLDRETTAEEAAFLQEPNSSF